MIWYQHRIIPIQWFAVALVFTGLGIDIAYGYQIAPDNDPMVKLGSDVVQGLAKAMLPGAQLLNLLPICLLPFFYLFYGFKSFFI